MKSKFGNLLNVGIESEEESLAEAMGSETPDAEPVETETEDAVVDETLGADETVEAGETGIAEAEDGVEEATATMDELDEAADELDDAEATLESFLEDGGMSHQAAVAYGLTTKRLRKRLGAGAFSNTPSVEDFGGTGTRYQATVDSLEDIRETKDKVIKAISHYIEVAKKALKEFWLKIWDNSPRLKQRLKSLVQAAERGSGEANSETVKIGSAKALHLGGKIPTDMTGATKKTVDQIVGIMKGMSDQIVKDASELAKAFETQVKSVPDAVTQRVDGISNKGVKADGIKGLPSGYVVRMATDELMGGKKAFEGVPADAPNGMMAFVSIRTGLASVSSKADEKASETSEAPCLSYKVIADSCGHAARGCDAVTNYRRDFDKREKAFDTLVSQAKAFVGKVNTAANNDEIKDPVDKNEAGSISKDLSRYIGKFSSGAMGAPEQAARHLLEVAKAVGQYGATSLKAHGAKKEESEEEEGEASAA